MEEDDYDPDESEPTTPPLILIGDIGKRMSKKVDHIEVGVKGDTFKSHQDDQGRFIANLANLENGHEGISEILMKVVYKEGTK